MSKKRIMVLLMVLSLAALSSGSLALAQEKPFAGTTISVVVCSDPYAVAMEKAMPEFEKETGIKVNWVPLAYLELREKVVMNFVGKSPLMDVIANYCGWAGQWGEANWVIDLNPLVKRDADEVKPDDLMKSGMDSYTWKGKLIGIPIAPYYYFLYYRKDVLDEAGLLPPETLDEWLDIAAKTVNPSKNMYGFVDCYMKGAPITHDSIAMLVGIGGSPLKDPLTNMKPNLWSPKGAALVAFYKKMLDYAPPGAINFDWSHRTEAFLAGRVATKGNWSAAWSIFKNPEFAVPEVVEYGMAATLPSLEKGVKSQMAIGGWGLTISSFSKNEGAAWEFIKWFTRPDPEFQRFMNKEGGSPIRYSTLDDPELADIYPYFKAVLDRDLAGKVVCDRYLPRIPEEPELEEMWGRYLNLIMVDEMGIEEGLKKADEEAAKILEDYPMF